MTKRKFTDEVYKEVCSALYDYIVDEEDPILAGFIFTPTALKYNVRIDDFSAKAYPKLSELAELAFRKQEAYVLRKGMNGQATGMSIFRLKQKQFGYTDRTEQNITSNGEQVQFFNSLPRPNKDDKTVKNKSKKK